MWGVALASLSSLFQEIFSSIGKYQYNHHQESAYTMAFLALLGGILFFGGTVFLTDQAFIFVAASLPTFIPRVILSVAQEYVTIRAIMEADRSTFSFVRVGTIPLLLGVDVILGYTLSFQQLAGILILLFTLIYLFSQETLNKKGLGLLTFSTINAVVVISLYKYNITHFNSVAAEQIILYLILMVYFWIGAMRQAQENPLTFLKKPLFVLQAFIEGAGGMLNSFAYMFAPASIITAAARSSAMFWTIASGRMYFKEKNVLQKVGGACLLALGTILLAF